jgi:adenylate cyclase
MNPGDPHACYNVACVYALVGKTEQSVDLLEKAIAAGFFFKDWARTDPDLNSLRAHPRFQALLA